MIAASRSMAGVAVVVAVTFHLGGVMRLDLIESVAMEGGHAGATVASLGNAFADLAQGTLTGAETADVLEPVTVEDAVESPEPTDNLSELAPPDEMQAAEPGARVAETVAVDPTERTDPEQTIASAVLPETPLIANPTLRVTPSASQPSPLPERLTTFEPVRPVAPAPSEAVAPADTLTAVDTDQIDLTQSLRPKVRSRAFEERNKKENPPPAPRQATSTASRAPDPPSPRGNGAQTNTRVGAADGTAARAAQKTTGTAGSTRAGNAAASNYPGKVMRKVQRVRRPRVGESGAATVSFRVASNGGLSALTVARSSGSRALDNAALQVIRRAAPFPVPPPGAQRSFRIQIKGR